MDVTQLKKVKKMGILGLQEGQLINQINYELERVINNINDINTDDRPREINIKIKITPIQNKKQLVVESTATSKIRPLNKVQSTLFNSQKTDKDTGIVYTQLREVSDIADGQLNIDGEIQEAPEPIVIGIDL